MPFNHSIYPLPGSEILSSRRFFFPQAFFFTNELTCKQAQVSLNVSWATPIIWHVCLGIPFTSPYEQIFSDRWPSDDNPTTNVQSANYHWRRTSQTPSLQVSKSPFELTLEPQDLNLLNKPCFMLKHSNNVDKCSRPHKTLLLPLFKPCGHLPKQLLEAAIKFYQDRLQTDLGDFRATYTRLILKEKDEKEKWRTLCLKMMKERDTARQKVSALISEWEIHLSSSLTSSSPSAAPGPVSSTESIASKVSKQTRKESDSQENTQELPSLVEPRPIRSLRSPIPSPPASPSASHRQPSILPLFHPPPLIVKAAIPLSHINSTIDASSDSSQYHDFQSNA